jgi:hypothetical protein
MTRKQAILLARVAGYHRDHKIFTRLMIESHIAMRILKAAWKGGVLAKEAGVPCDCDRCASGELDFRLAIHFFEDNRCTLCGKIASNSLARASHLWKHEREGKMVHQQPGPNQGQCARWALSIPQ